MSSDKDMDLDKLDAKCDSLSYTSNITPPLYDTDGGPPPTSSSSSLIGGGRSFTIPTPESSPSSCTSEAVFHPSALHHSVGGSASIGGPSGHPLLDGVRYALPTPDVSPLDSQGRPLEYASVGYQLQAAQDRFNFEASQLPGIILFL